VLINWLLMARGHSHFECRQRPTAPECWCHLNTAVWLEVCRARTEACKQVWAKNYSSITCIHLGKITSLMTYNHISLSWKEPQKRKMIQNGEILTLKSNYNPCQYREGSYDVRAFEFSPSHLRIWLPVQQ